MIALIATLRLKDGMAEQFEDIFRELMAAVRSEEPGCLVYRLAKSRTEADTYKVMELYQDQAALDAHGQGEALRAMTPRMAECLAGRPQLEFLDAVI